MLHVLAPILLAAASFSGGLLMSRITRKSVAPGDHLFLSLDAFDGHLLDSNKVANVRVSKTQALAEASHGENGVEVVVVKNF